MSEMSRRMPRLPQLDGLRAVAILMVMLHHMLPPNWRSGTGGTAYARRLVGQATASGVELFFVLSGVVLLGPYLLGKPFRGGEYVRRRMERIWPPYLVALAITATLAWWLDWPRPEIRTLPLHLAIVNLGWRAYSPPWWSLTPELLFYWSLPAILWLVSRWPTVASGVAALACLSAVCAALTVNLEGVVSGTSGRLLLFATYFPCFVAGCVVSTRMVGPAVGRIMTVVGFAGALACPLLPEGVSHLAYAVVWSGVVAIALGPEEDHAAGLSGSLAVWIGERSYSLFLLHYTAFLVAYQAVAWVFARGTLAYYLTSRAVAVPFAFGTAMLLFWYVERMFARNLHTADQFWPPLGEIARISSRMNRRPKAGCECPRSGA